MISVRTLCFCLSRLRHRTTQGTGGELGIIPEHLVEDMPLLVFFPAIELFNDSGYLGPEPSILPCCHGVRALRGPPFLVAGI